MSEFERVLTVLECVGLGPSLTREFAGFTGRREATAQGVCQRRTEEEASRFCANDHVGLQGSCKGNEPLNDLGNNRRIRQQWQQVAEEDPWAGEVGDLVDALLEINHSTTVAIIAEQRIRS